MICAMREKRINFARDFTKFPGGRARIHGDHSGEEFREDVLKPALDSHDVVILNLNGVVSFPASFVDEAFGILVEELGLDRVKNQIQFVLDDNPLALRSILLAMEAHAA